MGKKADVTVHISETLDTTRTTEVCRRLEALKGVEHVRCAEHKPHLLIVEFDPDSISTDTILHKVTSEGLHAQLIGL